jgi:hypothetical protein
MVMGSAGTQLDGSGLAPDAVAAGSAATRRPPATSALARERGERRQIFVQLASVVIVVVAITGYVQLRRGPNAPKPVKIASSVVVESTPAPESKATVDAKLPVPAKATEAPPPPAVDRAAVAAAEAALDAASRDRARADERAAARGRALGRAATQAAADAIRARKLAFVVRDPSARISQASTRGGFLRGEREKLEKEMSTLRALPRPKSTSILSKSPVARAAASDEYHFELYHNRITFIDLERLLVKTREDAQVRIRMSDRVPVISNKIGPVGAFSLEYELVRAVPGSMEELLERKSLRFDLRSWELVPENENRGETFDATRNPLSEFSRAISRISPGRSTITLWVYPDSFPLYRRIRGELIEHGFSVAGRPLPEGVTIRGSPLGTQSAAQ